jgi:hypothetical protein
MVQAVTWTLDANDPKGYLATAYLRVRAVELEIEGEPIWDE